MIKLLHNIGTFDHSNYTSIDKVIACQEQLTFDGVYRNVHLNKHALLYKPKKTILFVMWEYVGLNNKFDAIPNNLPLERFCDWNEIMDLVVNYNCEIGSHSWTHRNLTELTDDEVRKELKSPVPCRTFCYPYGVVDARIAKLVEEAGYEEAYSVNQGDGSKFQINREYL